MRANYLTIKVLLAAAAYINYLMMNYFYLQRLFYYLSSGQEMVHWWNHFYVWAHNPFFLKQQKKENVTAREMKTVLTL